MAGKAPVTVFDRATAFTPRMPGHSFFCGPTAAVLNHMPLPHWWANITELHVGVAPPARALDVRGIVGRRIQLRDDETYAFRGMRMTTPSRTWIDLAGLLTLPWLVAVADHLINISMPVCSRQDLSEALDSFVGRRGRPALARALALASEFAESPPESLLRVAIVQAGYPCPEVNESIFDERGRFVARADLMYRAERIVIEYEGDGHRSDQRQWRKDISRFRRYADLGWRAIRVHAADLPTFSEPLAVLGRMLAA